MQTNFARVAALAGAVLCSFAALGCGADSTQAVVPGVDTTSADAAVDDATGGDGASATDAADDGLIGDTGAADGGDDSKTGDGSAADVNADGSAATDAADTGSPADADATDPPDAGDSTTPDVTQPDTNTVDAGPAKIDKYTEHPSACGVDTDCALPCANGQCVGGKCALVPRVGACLVELGDAKVGCYGDGMQHPSMACLSCNTKVQQNELTSIVALVALDDDTDAVKTEDLSKGGISWTLSQKRSVSGGVSLYFGDPATHLYANDKQVKASATTAALAVPDMQGPNPELEFWLWLSTEQTKGFDALSVEIIADAKAAPAWHSDTIGGSTGGVWRRLLVDLSAYKGKSIAVRFTFDSIDGYVNAYEGAYIDAIAIRTGCCGSPGDCHDGNACSTDTCTNVTKAGSSWRQCEHKVTADCCSTAVDCDDAKPCTLDICSAAKAGELATCSHSAKPGCCMVQADCDDNDSCTVDQCPKVGAQCQHTNTCCKADGDCTSGDPCLTGSCIGGACSFKSTCCVADADCDDFNNCTVDACDNGKCVQTPALVPGCCSPLPWAEEFEVPVQGWTADPPSNGLEWFVETGWPANTLADGKGALVFGVKGQKSLGDWKTYGYGYILSPVIELPAGQDATLEIQTTSDLKMQTGTVSTSNRIYVYAYNEAKASSLIGYIYFNKLGQEKFTMDVSAYAGKKFQLRLRGYIYGYSTNAISGSGLLIDSIRMRTTCAPKICTADKPDCNPFTASCITGVCSDGLCKYQSSCCQSAADCVSPDACTEGSCNFTQCAFTKKKDCCVGDKDCDDGAKCSQDTCSGPGGTCSHAKIAGCSEPFCGDGKCDGPKETCFTCAGDCGKCQGCGQDPSKSCSGKCGKYDGAAACQCDSSCNAFQDCCPDKDKCCAP